MPPLYVNGITVSNRDCAHSYSALETPFESLRTGFD